MKRIICILTLIFTAAAAGFADIPRPDKSPKNGNKKSIETNMIIRLDSNATEARLLIPKSELKQLRAQLDEMDDDSDNTAAVTSFGRTQTIVSGIFLSLAIVFGGIWFVRSGKGSTRTGKVLVIGAMLAGIGSADPPDGGSPDSRRLSKDSDGDCGRPRDCRPAGAGRHDPLRGLHPSRCADRAHRSGARVDDARGARS